MKVWNNRDRRRPYLFKSACISSAHTHHTTPHHTRTQTNCTQCTHTGKDTHAHTHTHTHTQTLPLIVIATHTHTHTRTHIDTLPMVIAEAKGRQTRSNTTPSLPTHLQKRPIQVKTNSGDTYTCILYQLMYTCIDCEC